MSRFNPYLRFNDGTCREAMNFYKECFGGKLELMVIGDTPMAKDMPADKHNLIMHAELSGADFTLFGSDMMRDKAVVGDNVTVAVECKSEDELNGWFSKIATGGDVFMKPEETFWGAMFGVATDKYGVEWMFNFQKKPMK